MPRYIKFMQGTSDAFEKLPRKDCDTIYSISDGDNVVLYLGDHIIGNEQAHDDLRAEFQLANLKDVKLSTGLFKDSMLIYNPITRQWVNKRAADLTFVGATQSSAGVAGFVPAPKITDEKSFLAGDGQWRQVEIPEPIDTYTKEEIDNKVSAAAHLRRKMVNTVEDINLHAELYKDAEQYIYMVPTGLTLADNRYDEYMILPVIDEDGVEIQAIERVGTWEIDLSDYVKKSEIVDLYSQIAVLQERIAALEAAVQGQI